MTAHVGVTGGRHYDDYPTVCSVLDDVLRASDGMVVHVGDAMGLDYLARCWGQSRGVHVEVYRADWVKHGRAAGPIRNRLLVDKSDVLYAFKGGRGTADCVATATRVGIPVWRVT